jgi:hypothetical protein
MCRFTVSLLGAALLAISISSLASAETIVVL